jgi:hypothetical protein
MNLFVYFISLYVTIYIDYDVVEMSIISITQFSQIGYKQDINVLKIKHLLIFLLRVKTH